MVLETEVCDSDSKEFVLKINEPAESFDQSFRGVGSRPSPSNIEDIIEKASPISYLNKIPTTNSVVGIF